MKKFFTLLGGLLIASGVQAADNMPEALYLVGSFNDWKVPADGGTDYALTDPDGDGVYTGEFTFEGTELSFKVFDSKTAGWEDKDNYFSTYYWNKVFSDEPAQLTMSSIWTRNITITNWKGGKLSLSAVKKHNDTDEEDYTYWELTLASSTQPLSTVVEPATDLYLIGYMQDWDIFNGQYKFEMTAPQVFEGSFRIPANQYFSYFRFYTELGNWNYGSVSVERPSDQPDGEVIVPVEFTDDVFTSPCVYGENGNWSLGNWPGGEVKIKVDLNTMDVTFTKLSEEENTGFEHLYVIGTPQGWNISDGRLPLERIGENVFCGQFDVSVGSVFRFYTELNDWESNSVGSQFEDSPININEDIAELENTVTGKCVWGKGSWQVTKWDGGGELLATVNLNDMTVTFTHTDGSLVEGILYEADEAIYYDLLGRRVMNPDKGIYIRVTGPKTEKVAL